MSVQPGVGSAGTRVELEDFPARDSVIGFAALFRQLYVPSETGSFVSVRNIVGKVNAQASDSATEQRAAILKRWRTIENSLKTTPLKIQAGIKLQGGRDHFLPQHHDLNPQQLISLYLYGDWLHWGEAREQHATFVADPVIGPLRDFTALEAMASFTHLYMGFTTLLSAAFSGVIVGPQKETMAPNEA
ncbi:hypothetical protein AB0F52_01545 [Amycolatopsis sp. NPDC024027]|uniref:hypothetical protein n=1 Tax=Amycolatopsis sp. NPDC024027 TaxID=3154327 RepID=UPI0033FEFD7A